MKKKILSGLAACVLLAGLVPPVSAALPAYEDGAGLFTPIVLAPQEHGSHTPYMNGYAQGLFRPERALTRAELAKMLYEVVENRQPLGFLLSDVPDNAWYTPAVETVVALGLMQESAGTFRPDDPATRAECAYALSMLLPGSGETSPSAGFPDVLPGHWAYDANCRTAAHGLFQGDDTGNFRPEAGLKRCEAVKVFNVLLGRSPDRQTLSTKAGLPAFADVPRTHWAYYDIMEAAVEHQYSTTASGETWTHVATEAEGLPNGPVRMDGRLRWVVDGAFARNSTMGGLYFDANGYYTTGDAELDVTLNALVEKLTTATMTRDEKLRALYNYCRDNFTYLKRSLIEKGQTGWEPGRAKFFLANGKGNCYDFSATYCLLCRELGLPAYTVVGRVLNGPHGWVEIQLDGQVYMFDPQLEWRYRHQYKRPEYNLFKMSPNNTPFVYSR